MDNKYSDLGYPEDNDLGFPEEDLGFPENKPQSRIRADGTQKGQGYFGELKRPGGGVSTEISIGVNIDGKEMEIPTLVPTLNQSEIDYLVGGGKPTKEIVNKAVEHARQRMLQNKSPFNDSERLELEGQREEEKRQKEQAKMQEMAIAMKKAIDAANPVNWTIDQTKKMIKENPPQTPEEEIKAKLLLKTKEEEQKRIIDQQLEAMGIKEPTKVKVEEPEGSDTPMAGQLTKTIADALVKPFMVPGISKDYYEVVWQKAHEPAERVRKEIAKAFEGVPEELRGKLLPKITSPWKTTFNRLQEIAKKQDSSLKFLSGDQIEQAEQAFQEAVIGELAATPLSPEFIGTMAAYSTPAPIGLKPAVNDPLASSYKILGVKPDASMDKVESAYHKMVLDFHPDRVTGTAAKKIAEVRFQEIGDAIRNIRAANAPLYTKAVRFFKNMYRDTALGSEAGEMRIGEGPGGELIKPKKPIVPKPVIKPEAAAVGPVISSGAEEEGESFDAVRTGDVSEEGAYFSTEGSSTYYDPEGGAAKYKISNAKIATSGTPQMREVLEKAKALKNSTEELKRINDALVADKTTDNFVDYNIFDEVPSIKKAAEMLGYDGVKVWENDDIADPSSVFLWNTKKAQPLSKVASVENKDDYDFLSNELKKENEGRTITPEEKGYQDYVLNNIPEAKNRYNEIIKKQYNGATNIVSPDAAKSIFDSPITPENSVLRHAIASTLSKLKARELLANPDTKDLPGLVLSGGSGVGKTTALNPLGVKLNKYAAVFDVNTASEESQNKKIDQILDSGREVDVVDFYRDPIEAYINTKGGVLQRSIKNNRLVTIAQHLKMHFGVRPGWEAVVRNRSANPNIHFRFVDNSDKNNPITYNDLDKLPKIGYTLSEAEDRIYEGVKDALQSGTIKQKTFDAAIAESPGLQERAYQEGIGGTENRPDSETTDVGPQEQPARSGELETKVESSYQKLPSEEQAEYDLFVDSQRKTPEGNLFVAIKKLGGIAPFETGYLSGEYKRIPIHLKNKNSKYNADRILADLEDYGWKFETPADLFNAIDIQATNPDPKVNRGELREIIRQSKANTKLQQKLWEESTKRRKFITTVKEAEKTAPEVAQGVESRYTPISNKETIKEAQTYVEGNYDEAVELVLGPTRTDTFQNAVAITLIDKAQAEGRIEEAIRLVEKIAEKNTELGQAIQALSMYERLSPEGILRYTKRVIDNAQKNIKQKERLSNFERLSKDITSETDRAALAKKLGLPYLSPEEAAKIYDMAVELQKMEPGRDKQIQTALLLKEISTKIPPGLGKKISMIQTMAQLLNPKTLIRNVFGNLGFQALENITDTFATSLDIAASLMTGKRTVFMPNLVEQTKGMKQGLQEGAQEAMLGIDLKKMGQKFDLPKNGVFDTGVLGALEKTLGLALKATDRSNYQAAFNQSLRQQLENAGIEEPTGEMIEKAHALGLYRTFQDDNVISTQFAKLKTWLNNWTKNVPGMEGDFGLGDIVLKYPKTPANLLARGIEYSPAGAIKAFFKLGKPLYGGKASQEEFVREFSRGVTGSVLLIGVGGILASLGIIGGKRQKDKDVSATRENVGLRDYQINISALKRFISSGFDPDIAALREGDQFINYDWFLPSSIGLALGANLVLAKDKNMVDQVMNLGERLATASETLAEQPVVRGIKTLTQKEQISAGLMDVVRDIPASFIPTFLNQIKQLTDNTVRNTKDPNYFKEIYNKVANRIPGLSKTLPARVNTLGEEKEMYQLGSNNPFNVFLNPAFASKYKPDPASKMVLDIWQTTGQTIQFPRVAQAKIKLGSEERELTPGQYNEYQKYVGNKTSVLFTMLSGDPNFMSIDDDTKAKKLQGYLTDINTMAKMNVLGYQPKRIDQDVLRIIRLIGYDVQEIKRNSEEPMGEPEEELGIPEEEELGVLVE